MLDSMRGWFGDTVPPQVNAPALAALDAVVPAVRALAENGHRILSIEIRSGRAYVQVGDTFALRRMKRAEKVIWTAHGMEQVGDRMQRVRMGQVVKPSCIVQFYERGVQ